MAAAKSTTGKKTTAKKTLTKPGAEYVFQPFGTKSLALIHKYSLQTDESYKKLISSYERIDSLPEEDPRRDNLVELWETEFNRLFKEFWETYSGQSNKNKSGIDGWKDRLAVKEASTSPDAKRNDLLSRLTPGHNSSGRVTKEEILDRAGFQDGKNKQQTFNFTAEGKTGQNLREIESLLEVAETMDLAAPESFLSNDANIEKPQQPTMFSATRASSVIYDENGQVLKTNEDAPVDPNLQAFIDGDTYSDTIDMQTEELSQEVSGHESMSREEFNASNNLTSNEMSEKTVGQANPFSQPDDAYVPFDLEAGIFDGDVMKTITPQQRNEARNDNVPMSYSEKDEAINPDKRNIVSKDGFEVHRNDADYSSGDKAKYDVRTGDITNASNSKPYHEVKPVGHYEMTFDHAKRPSMQEIIESHKRETQSMDEMTEKIEFLRDLRNERTHRMNMMKIERANSYIVARSQRLQEARELKRIKKRDELNLQAIERAEKMKRAQERAKLIDLMKDRQMKRAEEKRVATVLRLERERRLEKDAKYRAEIASIDAQIRHEQELIKRTELKMKSYFTKNSDDKAFDDSLQIARKSGQYVVTEDKADRMLQLEETKRKDRIEKISRKFSKNIK